MASDGDFFVALDTGFVDRADDLRTAQANSTVEYQAAGSAPHVPLRQRQHDGTTEER